MYLISYLNMLKQDESVHERAISVNLVFWTSFCDYKFTEYKPMDKI